MSGIRRQTPPDVETVTSATRLTALVCAAGAIACLAAAGGLAPVWVPAAVVGMAVAELVAASAASRPARRVLLPLGLLVVSAPAIVALLHAAGDPDEVRAAGARLAAGALVVLPLAGAGRREHLTRFSLAAVTTGLALSIGGTTVLLPVLGFGLAALVLLLRLERDRLLVATTGSRTVAVPPTAPAGPRRGLPAAGVAVAVTAVFSGTLAAYADLPEPRQLADAGAPGGAGPSSAGGAGRWNAATGVMDLRRRGDLPRTEVARVATDDELLWRSTVLTRYRGGGWRALPDDAAGTGLGSDGVAGTDRRDEVTLLGGSGGLLLTPGEPRRLDVRLRRVGVGEAVRVPRGPYTLLSTTPVVPSGDRTPVAATADEQATHAAALALPPLPGRVGELAAQLTAGSTTRAEAVTAVVDHLRASYRYRLDSPVPERGQDPVDDFLFVSREGFCEQFASAAAVLLRSVGVPARVAVGYAGGELTAATDGSPGRLLRGTDAHAWIEVAYPSGWVAADPTAGSVPTEHTTPAPLRWLRDHGGTAVALGALGALAAGGLVLGGGTLARRRSEAGLDPVERALRRLDRRLGDRRRRPEETLRDFAERVGLDRHEREAVVVAEQLRYGERPPEQARVASAVGVLRRAGRR